MQRRAFYSLIEDGVLCRQSLLGGNIQWVIPEARKEDALELHQDSPMSGHPGSMRMYRIMRRHTCWPTMMADVRGHVHNCSRCARSGVGHSRLTSDMKLFPATEPFQSVSMELLEALS